MKTAKKKQEKNNELCVVSLAGLLAFWDQHFQIALTSWSSQRPAEDSIAAGKNGSMESSVWLSGWDSPCNEPKSFAKWEFCNIAYGWSRNKDQE